MEFLLDHRLPTRDNPQAVVRSILTRRPAVQCEEGCARSAHFNGPRAAGALGPRLRGARDHPRLTPFILCRSRTRHRDRRAGTAPVRRSGLRSPSIVHNLHVVRRLEQRGAIFVQGLDEVPDRAVVVLAAHGVARNPSPGRRASELSVIDATCPLVTKVHTEARRFAAALQPRADRSRRARRGGRYLRRGTRTNPHYRVGSDVDRLDFEEGQAIAYVTRTTLATDETAEIISAL